MAIIINFSVNLQPRFLLIGGKVFQNLHQIANHLFANPSDQRGTLGRNANHYFATIIERNRAYHVTEILKARHVICVVPDGRKARAVRDCLELEVSPYHPASALQQHGGAIVYLDRESASLLKDYPKPES